MPKPRTKKLADKIGKPAPGPKPRLESLIKYSGDAPLLSERYNLDLFKSLNRDYEARPVVPAPRPHSLEYGTSIGAKRAAMLEKKIGIRGLRVLELGCGAGAMSRVLASDFDCAVTGVDIGDYPEWQAPLEGDLSLLVHDITSQDNSRFGVFDRVVSFAVFEHIVHPHAALKAIFDMLKPGGKAYIYANLYRGAKASHRYREVYFPWAHLLFEPDVWRDFYTGLQGEPLEPAWVNKLTYDQYVNYARRAGFDVLQHFPSASFFDETFYQRFEQRLSAYPKYDLMHDFIHLVLKKPLVGADPSAVDSDTAEASEDAALLNYAPRKGETADAYGAGFWAAAGALPSWRRFEADWHASRRDGATAIADQRPWVTFAAIDYLESRVKPGHRVFEWGSGGSTLFFASRGARLVSVEHEKTWHAAVAEELGGTAFGAYVQNILVEPGKALSSDRRFSSGDAKLKGFSFEDYVRQIELFEDGAFDLVIVDGRARMGCLEAALSKVARGGAVMLDNANYPRYREGLASLRANELRGWKELRLAGPGPYSRTPCWETIVWERPKNGPEDLGEPLTAVEVNGVRQEASAWPTLPALSLTDIPAIRRCLGARPSRNYDSISYIPDEINEKAITAILSGQSYDLFGMAFNAADIGDWGKRHAERSGGLFLQSWDHLEPLFSLWSGRDNEAAFEILLKCLAGWGESAASAPKYYKDGGSGNGAAEDFSNYDTAVANRFFRLAYFLDRAAPHDQLTDAGFLALMNVLISHLKSLLDESGIAWRHNHGLYQVLAQVCGASRFTQLDGGSGSRSLALHMRHALRTGVDRLDLLLESQFTGSGIQKEHSPFYHVAMANALDWVVGIGIVDDPAVKAARSRILNAAGFMFDQDGALANFGDSDLGFSLRAQHEGDKQDGVESELFGDAGYWFVKGEGAKNPTYLAQSCAFHSRFHKQADSGTLIWRDRGLDVLIDSGRYGYAGRTEPGSPLFLDGFWYADPKRVHVESTRAHNTVEIDQQNHRRYRQAPLGGTITGERFNNGVHASRCAVPNAGRAQHQRFTLLLPNKWLLIVDTCRFPDGAHDMRQWFQLHPGWVHRAEQDKLIFVNGEQRLSIIPMFANMETDGIFRGERVEPVNPSDSGFRGWWSPEALRFEPCTSLAFRASGAFTNMATLISFEDVDLQGVTANVNATSRSFVFRWRDAENHKEVKLTSGGLGREEFDVAFKSRPRQSPSSV